MGRSKIYLLAGAAFLSVPAAGALAADIPEIPPPVHFSGGWYLRGDIGITNQQVGSLFNALYDDPGIISVTNLGKDFSSSPLIGLGIGYQHSEHLRFDLTGEYRSGADFHGLDSVVATGPTTYDDNYTGIKKEWTFLANAYWDIGKWGGFTPFLGAGAGFSYNTITNFTDVSVVNNSIAYGASSSKLNFAWALYAGMGYQVSPNLTIEAAYRYIDLGNAASGDLITYTGTNTIDNPMEFRHLTSHDFKVGFRWAFDAPQQSSYYPPVVKY